jgi:hypothetical protein
MSEQLPRQGADDSQGDGFKYPADGERAENDDVEGHGGRLPDGGDDVQGHGYRPAGIDAFADDEDDAGGHMAPRPSGIHDPVTDDVEGRRFPTGTTGPQREDDDTAGHGSRFNGVVAEDEDDVAGHALGPVDPKRA